MTLHDDPFQIERDGTTLRLRGELDMATAPEAQVVFDEACAAGGLITVDLAEISFMDSTGLGVLLKARQHADANGCEMEIQHVPDAVARLFDLTGTRDYLEGKGG